MPWTRTDVVYKDWKLGSKNKSVNRIGKGDRLKARGGSGRPGNKEIPGWGIGIILAAIATAVYYPALKGGFIWDDIAIVKEGVVHRWEGIADIWFAPRAIVREGHYWPLVYTTFWIEHKLWGLDPRGYHAVNVTLHAVNTVMVWKLLERLGVKAAWLAAALFAVHPVHVEAVAWIIERKTLLSTACYLMAFTAWLRYEETGQRRDLATATGLYGIGLLAKSMIVTLPAVVLMSIWWKKGGITTRELRSVWPLVVVGGTITTLDFVYYRSIESVEFNIGAAERVLNAGQALWFYFGKLIWPTDLAGIYPWTNASTSSVETWGKLLVLAGIGAMVWAWRKEWGRGPFAAYATFVISMAPILGFIDFGFMRFSLVADRFQYVASISVVALVAGLAWKLNQKGGTVKTITQVGIVSVVGALAATTWSQAKIYDSQVVYFSHVVEHNPGLASGRFNLAKSLKEEGRRHESLIVSTEGVEQHPQDRRFGHQVGEILRIDGHYKEAELAYRKSLGIDPDYAIASMGLGLTLIKMGRAGEAIQYLTKAADISEKIRNVIYPSIAKARLMKGDIEGAVEDYKTAIANRPSDVGSHANLGAVFAATGRNAEAIEHLEEALRLKPNMKFAVELMKRIGKE